MSFNFHIQSHELPVLVPDPDYPQTPWLRSLSALLHDSAPRFERIPDLYFPDGNIILEVESTHFRVSSSILAARSTVFRDVLSLPQPGQGRGKVEVDGCDVIQLAADDPAEFAYFLRAIFDSSFFEPPPVQTTITIVIAVLRLSTKYDVRYLRQRALKHLHTLYPLTLEGFDMRQKRNTIPWQLNTAFYVADLAHQMGMEWLLPSALYYVCAGPLEYLAQGYVWEGESIQMNMENKVRCLRALSEMGNRRNQDVLGFLTVERVTLCRTPNECRRGRLEMLQRLNAKRTGSIDRLGVMYPEQEKWRLYGVVCQKCRNEGKRAYREGRMKLWDALPEIFGLQDWEVLTKSKMEA